MVGLDAADGDERVATLFQRLRDQVFQLAQLVAAEGQAAIAVLALGVELDLAAQVGRQPVQPFDGRVAEGQAVAGKRCRSMEAPLAFSSRAGSGRG